MSADSRLLQLEQLLVQNRYGLPKAQIAKALGVSPRTAYRYLLKLQSAGRPITGEGEDKSGQPKRWKIDRRDFWGLPAEQPPLGLSSAELFAIAAALEAAPLPRCPWLDQARKNALVKLNVTLGGPAGRAMPVMQASLFPLGPDPGKEDRPSERVVEALLEAMIRNRRLSVVYPWRSSSGQWRTIEPHAILLSRGTFYLAVRILPHPDIRHMMVSHIRRIRILDEEFARMSRKEFKARFAKRFALYEEEPQEVRVRFSPATGQSLRKRRIHPSQKLEVQGDGSLILTMLTGGKMEFLWWLLQWGANAEILEPREWRKGMASIARRMNETYNAG